MSTLKAEAVLFDLDGTLVDSTRASEISWRRWARDHRVPFRSVQAVHHGRRPQETVAIVAPHLDSEREARRIYAEQETLLEGTAPIEGAAEFFRSVPTGRAAVVTSATLAIVKLRFKIVGLEPPAVCVTADLGLAGKPQPDGYLEAARRLGVRPADCVVFEDAPVGVIAAHRAGMRSIAILSNYMETALRAELAAEELPVAFLPDYRDIQLVDGRLEIAS